MDPRTRRRQKRRRRKKMERWQRRRDLLRAMRARFSTPDARRKISAVVSEHIRYQLDRPPSPIRHLLLTKERSNGA